MTADIIRGAFGLSAPSVPVSASTKIPPVTPITFEELHALGVPTKTYLERLLAFLREEGFSTPARNAAKMAAPQGVSPRGLEMYQERIMIATEALVTGSAEPAKSEIYLLFCFLKALAAIVKNQSDAASPGT